MCTINELVKEQIVSLVNKGGHSHSMETGRRSLRDHYGELQGAGYEVVGVSKDSAASHVKFKEKHELPFPLIADVDHTLLEAMGAWGEKNMYGKKTMGTIRTTFIINEEGIIEQIFAGKQVKTKEHAEQILHDEK